MIDEIDFELDVILQNCFCFSVYSSCHSYRDAEGNVPTIRGAWKTLETVEKRFCELIYRFFLSCKN